MQQGKALCLGTLAALVALAPALAARGQELQPQRPQPLADGAAARLDPELERILDRLEQRQVRDLRAEITWRNQYVLSSDAQTKRGMIWYAQGEPVAKFKVRFDTKIAGDRREKLGEEHLFDGNWYVELQPPPAKMVIRREIRAASDRRNPYKLGEGAFPVPFGQTKADILREFEVQRVTATNPKDPPDCDHIRMIPRPGASTEDRYASIDFWISRGGPASGLPVQVSAQQKDGTGEVNSTITLTFEKIELNTGFNASVFEIKVPAGYQESIEPLGPPGAARPDGPP